jgi:hypothetical protein
MSHDITPEWVMLIYLERFFEERRLVFAMLVDVCALSFSFSRWLGSGRSWSYGLDI